MEIRATKRFLKRMSGTTGQDLVKREILDLKHFLERKKVTDNNKWPDQCKPILGTSKAMPKLMEWKMSVRARIIFHDVSNPVLVDFDLNHESVDNLLRDMSPSSVSKQVENSTLLNLEESQPLDARLLNKITGISGDFGIPIFEEELFDEWVHFLDEEQESARDSILTEIRNEAGSRVILLQAGAGTGKTSILTNLAFSLAELGIAAQLEVNEGVRALLLSGQRDIPGLKQSSRISHSEVVLLDDPIDLDTLKKRIKETTAEKQRLIVGIDPTQWHQRRLSEKWHDFRLLNSHKTLTLRKAYRQTQGVGAPALNLISNFNRKSSAFVDFYKVQHEHSQMDSTWKLCLEEIEFINKSGGVSVHEAGWGAEVLNNFVAEVGTQKTERSWPRLLIGLESPLTLPETGRNAIREVGKRGIDHHIRGFTEVQKVRGTEYDFVALFIPTKKWELLNSGKLGLDTPDWVDLNKMLTFFTRAKSHVGVFLF